MIFDEATSALDTKHEVEVQRAIDAASKGITTVTIAHRYCKVVTIYNFWRLYELKPDGRL